MLYSRNGINPSYYLVYYLTIIGYYIQPDPISFSEHPSSQIVLRQSKVVLRCGFHLISLNSELPQPLIEWHFNDEPTSCTNINPVNDDSVLISTCTIEAVDGHHSGWYQCVVVDGNKQKSCKTLDCVPTKTASRPAFVHIICKFIVDLLVAMETVAMAPSYFHSSCQ